MSLAGRKKKYNKYERPIDMEIDLHGLYLQEAQAAFLDFLEEALESDYRRVRVITGKGIHSATGVSVLKEMVMDIAKAHDLKYREGKIGEGGEGVIIIDF